jgi:2-keto-4-pentenoate hydratase
MSDTARARVQEGARFLLGERQARKRFSPIPAVHAPSSIDDAYAIQEALLRLLAPTNGPVAGYKIGLTTAIMQEKLGVNAPIAGGILARTIQHSPGTARAADYVHLGVECEIAFQLQTELSAARAPFDRDTVAGAIGAAMPAFELIDDRHADFAQLANQVSSLVAANVFNAGIVLGPPVAEWRAIDLVAVRGTLRTNGIVAGEGRGSDVMGHPLEAVAWLANMLATRGRSLPAGMTIMTGSIVDLQAPAPGDVMSLSVEGLGEVILRVA